MLYEMLSGEKPYQGESEMDTVLKHLNEPVPQLAGDLAHLQPLLERMLAKQPDDRFQSAAELAERLAAARDAWVGEEEPPASAAEALSAGESAANDRTVGQQAPSVAHEPGERAGRGGWLIPAFMGTAIGIAIVVGVLLAGRAYLDELLSPSATDTTAAGDRPSLRSSAETAAASSAPFGASEAAAPPDGMGESPVDAGAQAVRAPAVVSAPAAAREPASAPQAVDPNAAKIASLLASANRAIDDFRLTRPAGNSAIDFIEQLLKKDPANEDARAAFKRIAKRYAVLARTHLGKSDYGKARLYVDRGLEVDAGNVDLQALDAELASRATAAVGESDVATSAREPAAPESGEIQGESPAELFNRIKGFFTN
jgi:serine/threonine-protein kinase PpkA